MERLCLPSVCPLLQYFSTRADDVFSFHFLHLSTPGTNQTKKTGIWGCPVKGKIPNKMYQRMSPVTAGSYKIFGRYRDFNWEFPNAVARQKAKIRETKLCQSLRWHEHEACFTFPLFIKHISGIGLKRWQKYILSINILTLSCVKWIASEKLLYNTGSTAWQSVMIWRGWMGWWVGGRLKREVIYV